MQQLAALLHELRIQPAELLIQPELKQPQRKQQDKQIREEQDLEAGAVLLAVVEEGQPGGCTPVEGDLVYVHVSVCPAAEGGSSSSGYKAVWSTRAEAGGCGHPLAFVLERGTRPPRAWEVALKGMCVGQRNSLRVRPAYGYRHPECRMQAPPGVPPDMELMFDLQLVQCYRDAEVRPCSVGGWMFRTLLQEGTGMESVRPPCEVTFHATLRALSSSRSGGAQWLSTRGEGQQGSGTTAATTGGGEAGIEEALGQMSLHERAVFVLPAPAVGCCGAGSRPANGSSSGSSSSRSPGAGGEVGCAALAAAVPAGAAQVEAELELVSIVQVRDVVGTGEVMKRKLREGRGEFPMDCPLHDTTVRVHYRVRAVRGGAAGPWVFDTREPQEGGAPAAPAEFDTGCGEVPAGLEQAVKLMVPGELALVSVRAPPPQHPQSSSTSSSSSTGQPPPQHGGGVGQVRLGYGPCEQPPPPGIEAGEELNFEVELLGFDQEGHWQVMSMADRFALVERVKARANAQVRKGKHAGARTRYLRVLRLVDSTRDFELQEDADAMDNYKLLLLSNLALCCTSLGEHAEAVAHCTKGLLLDEGNVKLLLRRGRALSLKGDHEEAELDFKAAVAADPGCRRDAEREGAANQQRARAAARKQREGFANFLSKRAEC